MSRAFQGMAPAALRAAVNGTVQRAYYRLTSLTRLPGKAGQGIYNEATLFHEHRSLRVSWTSATVDSRLRRGDIVAVDNSREARTSVDILPVQRIVRVDRAMPALNPFDRVPPSWIKDRSLVSRARVLWDAMDRPLQQLLNVMFWDGSRLYRYLTGPSSMAEYPAPPGGNFRRAVDLAEEALLLAEGLPSVARGVLVAAAFLRDAGKADDFRVASDGSGLQLSERGRWVGHEQTVLEWIAVARTRVIVPGETYHRLVHVLMTGRRPPEQQLAIEAAVLDVAHRFLIDPERGKAKNESMRQF